MKKAVIIVLIAASIGTAKADKPPAQILKEHGNVLGYTEILGYKTYGHQDRTSLERDLLYMVTQGYDECLGEGTHAYWLTPSEGFELGDPLESLKMCGNGSVYHFYMGPGNPSGFVRITKLK